MKMIDMKSIATHQHVQHKNKIATKSNKKKKLQRIPYSKRFYKNPE